MVPADRDLYPSRFRDNQFPRAVSDGGIVALGLCLGGGGSGFVLPAVPDVMEVFLEEIQQRKLLRYLKRALDNLPLLLLKSIFNRNLYCGAW